jgi:hypothetical protein
MWDKCLLGSKAASPSASCDYLPADVVGESGRLSFPNMAGVQWTVPTYSLMVSRIGTDLAHSTT